MSVQILCKREWQVDRRSARHRSFTPRCCEQNPGDRRQKFDTPTLIEIWRSGKYLTVKELLTRGKHSEKTEILTDEQIDDLVEFVLSE
jgi:hypothetical protein